MAENEKKKPVFESKVGTFQASVFINEYKGKNGNMVKLASAQLQKSWKDKEGEWQHAKMSLMNTEEIDKLIYVLQKTKEAMYTKTGQEKEEAQEVEM